MLNSSESGWAASAGRGISFLSHFLLPPETQLLFHRAVTPNVSNMEKLRRDNGCERTWAVITFVTPVPCSTGAEQECPIHIRPDRMVLEYRGESENATCQPTPDGDRNLREFHWEVQGGNKISGEIWSPDTHKDWDPRPVCTATFVGRRRCEKKLTFILYSTYLHIYFLLSLPSFKSWSNYILCLYNSHSRNPRQCLHPQSVCVQHGGGHQRGPAAV